IIGDREQQRSLEHIQLRAERRAGQILKNMEKAKGGRPSETPPQQGGVRTLAEHGITYDQTSAWQKLADVPEDTFERAADEVGYPHQLGRIVVESKCRRAPSLDKVPVSRDAL